MSTARWITVLLLVFVVIDDAAAQDAENVQSDLSFVAGIPVGDFADNIGAHSLGLSGSLGGRIPGLPVALFSEIGFLTYGLDDHLELTEFRDQLGDVDVTAPVSVLGIESNNHILMGHLVGRLQPFVAIVSPYVDALLGFKYFFSKTRINGDVAFDWNALEAHADFDDLALSFGAGGGVQIQVFDGRLGTDMHSSKLFLDLGVRYILGPETSYLGRDAIQETEDGIRIALEESRVDMLIPKFGLRIER